MIFLENLYGENFHVGPERRAKPHCTLEIPHFSRAAPGECLDPECYCRCEEGYGGPRMPKVDN